MEQRIVTLQIKDEFILGAGVSVGSAGSHDDVLLEMDFRNSPAWEGTTRRAIFANALGENMTPIILTTNLLAEGQSEVYLVPVPAEAKEVAGECFLTVEGFVGEGEHEKVRIVAGEVTFRVNPSKLYSNDNPSLTPTEAEQLQKEVDEFKENVAQVNAALKEIGNSVDAAAESALCAEAWAAGTRGGEEVPEEDPAHENNAKWWSAVAEAAKTAADTAKIAAASAAAAAADTLASLVKTADEKISAAAREVVNAKSWAVGGTKTRADEETNNAKYWANQAKAAAGGGVTSFNGRTGFVMPEVGDYTAEMVGTYSSEQIDTLLLGFIAKGTVFNTDGSITETGADGSTKVTVFGDGAITETYSAGDLTVTKTTTFNADGSISESLAYEEDNL